ncbi:NUDIX hydrolase [Kocuria sp.]|uniref:NUDIX hydrolase n=1 Tax=Kocuria sp. TaxID=1871328 RepID=UPI0026DEA853|nr:NUDIX hydrolase [Kocuria sp.]MDO5618574.1 NUDIX hydrolase [Kocuria sp.]
MPNSPDRGHQPRRFPLLPEYRKAAEVWQASEGQLTPVTPLDAAGLMLLRDSPDGVETYLTTHAQRSPFGPVAFPGGPVDGDDDDPLPWVGPSSTAWGRRWCDDVGVTRRTVVAAARELFERTGILLAGPDMYSTVETGDGRDWMVGREEVLARTLTMGQLLDSRHLKLRTDLLWPVARWVTPEFLHRRYDTRFFAVILPERQSVTQIPNHPKPGLWATVDRLVAHLEEPQTGQVDSRADRMDTWLGDTLGLPQTVGRSQRDLLGATMSGLLQELAAARSVVEVIARPRDLSPQVPDLAVETDGSYELVLPRRPRRHRPRQGI